jgi:hypothetical protein
VVSKNHKKKKKKKKSFKTNKKEQIFFFYENGQGDIFDEGGNEAMDMEEDYDPFNVETLMTLSKYQTA